MVAGGPVVQKSVLLMVEFGAVNELLVFWWSGYFEGDPDEEAILDKDLLNRAWRWQETWSEHFARHATPGVGPYPWMDARCWDSEEVAFAWATEGVELFRELIRQLPDVRVSIDLWPLEKEDPDFYPRGQYRRAGPGVWTTAVTAADFEPRSLADFQYAFRRVLASRPVEDR